MGYASLVAPGDSAGARDLAQAKQQEGGILGLLAQRLQNFIWTNSKSESKPLQLHYGGDTPSEIKWFYFWLFSS